MKLKTLVAVAALLITAQAAWSAGNEKNHGCPVDAGCSPSDGGGSGGDGGGSSNNGGAVEVASFKGTWSYKGIKWDSYHDTLGDFDIETGEGKTRIHIGTKAALVTSAAQSSSQMKRAKLVFGTLQTAPTLADAKKKADQEKAAADKAAADKAAADAAAKNAAAGVYTGAPMGAQAAGGGMVTGGAAPVSAQNAAAGPIGVPKKKP